MQEVPCFQDEDVYKRQDEVHEHTSVYQLNELDFLYRQLSNDMQEEYVSLLTAVSYTHLFSIGTLLFVFVEVLLLLNMKQLMRTDWKHFSLLENLSEGKAPLLCPS